MKSFMATICLVLFVPYVNGQDTSVFDLQEPFFLAGEDSEDLTPLMQARKAEFEFRQQNKEALEMYRKGKIDEFSYFGFKLYDVENGKLELKDLILELQQYLTKNRK